MDISVRHLNHRMALQVPAELPLGLVFVVGNIENWNYDSEREVMMFDLNENGHYLRCHVSEQTAVGTYLREGDRVRAGGHLSFSPQDARYLLVAKDIEVLGANKNVLAGVTVQSELSSILADANKRAKKMEMVAAELPNWVKRMAPPEIRNNFEINEIEEEPLEDLSPKSEMDQALVAKLAQMMDSDDDVELTNDLLHDLTEPQTDSEPITNETVSEASTPEPQTAQGLIETKPEMPANVEAMYAAVPDIAPRPAKKRPPSPMSDRERVLTIVLVVLIILFLLVFFVLLTSVLQGA